MQDDIFSSLCYSVYHMVKTFKKITSSCSLVCKGSLSLSWRMVAIVPICTCPLLQPLCALLPFWLYTISLILFVPQNDMISCISDPLLLISFFCFKYEVPDLQTISFHSSTFFFFFFKFCCFNFTVSETEAALGSFPSTPVTSTYSTYTSTYCLNDNVRKIRLLLMGFILIFHKAF